MTSGRRRLQREYHSAAPGTLTIAAHGSGTIEQAAGTEGHRRVWLPAIVESSESIQRSQDPRAMVLRHLEYDAAAGGFTIAARDAAAEGGAVKSSRFADGQAGRRISAVGAPVNVWMTL